MCYHDGMQSTALVILLGGVMFPIPGWEVETVGPALPAYELVVRPGWHETDIPTVRQVVRSACDELMQYFPGRRFRPIAVAFRGEGNPQMFYEGGPRGRHETDVVLLTARSRFWCQYVYQFSHEHCHILHNADLPYPHEAGWFNESLSEVASLFVLRALSERWKQQPPFPGWESFAPKLAEYTEPILKIASLPECVTLAEWYARHEETLRADPINRELNAVVACRLLPWFEEEPSRWESLTWLNHRRDYLRDRSFTFAEVLAEWEHHCPPRHKGF
ncbi:MAG: hypothetical protein U1E05_10150, partial [Patescibacteria group bacterium]|nr:hypothetical protein [Patescibacteria group bacterium]